MTTARQILRLVQASVVALLLLSGCSGSDRARSDRARNASASKLIQSFLPSLCSIHVGEVTVVEGKAEFNRNEIGRHRLLDVEIWEKAGLVTVNKSEVLSESKPFSWDDWFARTQRGEVAHLTINPTERVSSLGGKTIPITDRGAWLSGPCWKMSVAKVVGDTELFDPAGGQYRVVEAIVRSQVTGFGELLAGVEVEGNQWSERSKSRAHRFLFQWNKFKGEWDHKAQDEGTAEGKFRKATSVPREIKKLQLRQQE